MIINFKKKLSLIIENKLSISHLSLFHFINIITPIIILPLLITNIQTEVLAKIFYYQAIFTFFSVFVSYGFNQYGINFLALSKNKKDNTIFFFQISILKLFFFIITYISLTLIFSSINVDYNDFIIFILSGWALSYDIVICDWFFQGIEKVSRINYLNFIFRTSNILLIIFLVNENSQGYLVPLIYSTSMFLVLIVNIYFLKFDLHLNKISLKKILNFVDFKYHLIESLPFFSSNFSSKIYLGSSKIILGKFGSPIDLVKFEVIDKVLTLMKVPNVILNQVFFPQSSRLFNKGKFSNNLKRIGVLINLPGIILLFVFGQIVFDILTTYKFEFSLTIYYIALLPIVIFIGQFYGLHQLVPMGKKNKFSININVGVILYIILILVGIFKELITLNFIILSLYLTEITISLLMYKSYIDEK